MIKVLEMFGEPISYGGQESVVSNMLSTFDLKNTFQVSLFTPYFANNQYLKKVIDDNNGIVFELGLKFKIKDNRFFLLKHIDKFFKFNNDYDIIHIHTGSLSTMLLYAMLAKKYNIKKVIAHMHTSILNESLFSKLRKMLICTLLKKYVDVLIGCSELAIKTRFTREIQNKSIIVYNGIDKDTYKFNMELRNQCRTEYKINDKFVIGFIGRIVHEKNVFFLIDILKELITIDRNIILIVVGDGELLNNLKSKTVDNRLEYNIIFTGNQIKTSKFYNAFDCFLLPSLHEGLPVTSIEAQFSKLPMIISENVSSECIISNRAIKLPIDNAKKWATEILKIKNALEINNDREDTIIDFDKYDRIKTFDIVNKIYRGEYVSNN